MAYSDDWFVAQSRAQKVRDSFREKRGHGYLMTDSGGEGGMAVGGLTLTLHSQSHIIEFIFPDSRSHQTFQFMQNRHDNM